MEGENEISNNSLFAATIRDLPAFHGVVISTSKTIFTGEVVQPIFRFVRTEKKETLRRRQTLRERIRKIKVPLARNERFQSSSKKVKLQWSAASYNAGIYWTDQPSWYLSSINLLGHHFVEAIDAAVLDP